MSEFKDRFAEALKASGKSATDVARALDLTASGVRHWLSGRRTPDIDAIRRVAEFLGADASWLAWGTGTAPVPCVDEQPAAGAA